MFCTYKDVLHPCKTTECFFPLQPSKLSENLVQQFLLPDETPPILEAEMALRAEQMVNAALTENKKYFPDQIQSPDSMNQKDDFIVSKPDVSDHKQENDSNLSKFPKVSAKEEREEARLDLKAVKEDNMREVRQEPEGQLADNTLAEEPKKPVVGFVVTARIN